MCLYKKLLLLILLTTFDTKGALDKAPQLTVVIVIDQGAYHYFPKLKNNLRYGFKDLLRHGVVYTKAFHPHFVPETTPGHHAISTGCYPKDHGGVTNQWFDEAGKKVNFEMDHHEDAQIVPQAPNIQQFRLKNGETLTSKSFTHHHNPTDIEGKSGRNTMVDNLSDQFLQFDSPNNPAHVFALSIKAYPAIALAGKMGKALWFDEHRGIFISSKKYFQTLPKWVEHFNNKTHDSLASYQWNSAYPMSAPEYDFPFIHNYEFTKASESYIGKFPTKITPYGAPRYFSLIRTPIANSVLFELAKACINQNLSPKSHDRMLLWISLSQLDLLTHLFGPDSMESIDSIYQLDRQIQDFITFINHKVGAPNCLIALTADHGIAPIPEIQQKKGFKTARRILAQNLIKLMNDQVLEKCKIPNIVTQFEPNSFWFNKETYQQLQQEKKTQIITVITDFLKKYPGIKNAWSYEELAQKDVRNQPFAQYAKMQLFQGRVGDIICLPNPYCQITNYEAGTGHSTPYNYDTHVPLILYQPNTLAPRIIHEKVYTQQLPVTLAKLLHISHPSASCFDILPGLHTVTH